MAFSQSISCNVHQSVCWFKWTTVFSSSPLFHKFIFIIIFSLESVFKVYFLQKSHQGDVLQINIILNIRAFSNYCDFHSVSKLPNVFSAMKTFQSMAPVKALFEVPVLMLRLVCFCFSKGRTCIYFVWLDVLRSIEPCFEKTFFYLANAGQNCFIVSTLGCR